MEIGNRLRFYRIQQNMTQEDLANGIISVSYLSKIENNQTSASIDALEMLCKRLGIKLIEEEELTLLKELNEWYYSIVHRNKDEAMARYEKYADIIQSTNDSTAYIHFVLFELRYFLLNREMDKAKEQLSKINLFKDIFDNQLSYYYHKFVGLYHYLLNKFFDAKNHYKLAERILNNSIHFEKWEEADLYYSIALTYSQVGKMALCSNYSQLALSIFQSIYDLKRSAECQILLGICYLRTEEYSLAEENYRLAAKVAQTMNDDNLLGIIHHNLGYLYSLKKEIHQAIYEYEKSLEYKKEKNALGRLRTIHSLVDEYYKLNDLEKCKIWIDEGMSLLQGEIHREYKIHFTIFEHILEDSHMNFEKYMEKEALPYFEKQENYLQVLKYAEMLAKHYEKKNKYKQASLYYSKTIKALKQQNYIY
ncbi:helix-turn-helix transcriptional regulator [Bacillus timonensis]|nr:helix-turn-helix transcriptional regulator [Bacillus timonensis]